MSNLTSREKQITLARKYELDATDLWLTGTQALVRTTLEQCRADAEAKRNTAGYITGYRGSPLAGLDLELGRAHEKIRAANIVFQPAINEDLGATAVWGSQQVGLFAGSRYDGVYGLWYGKSPGLDRSGDAIRHANMAGTAPFGGVLAVVGDDPDCKSSTLPSDSSGALRDLQLPILDPTDVSELIEFGLYGWALSRFTGCWVAMLAQTSVMDSSATVQLPSSRTRFVFPQLDVDPHIRLVDTPHAQEQRMVQKLALVNEFIHKNPINHVVADATEANVAIVTTGKSYTNVRQALHLLGLASTNEISRAGVRLIKLGLIWPMDRVWLRQRVEDAKAVLVVESKGALLENELKMSLYGSAHVPIVGKQDLDGLPLLTQFGELQVDAVIHALLRIAPKLNLAFPNERRFSERQNAISNQLESMNVNRKPLFCPGCPHSGSTKLPEDSRAFAGIGCHYMAQWMHRETFLFTHMGGEGANWIGQAPFTDTNHVFVNLGDGTYSHSGLLAIRAAVASKVNVTYKLLFNDAVAMTGGQAVEGGLTVADVVAQVRAEGVRSVNVVAEDVRVHKGADYPVSDRSKLQDLQRQLRTVEGCTVLIVDHACANEKRRKRKRGLIAPPQHYVMINEDVCEGCGDCVTKSGCSAIETVQTEFGEKRQIEQAHCIQDLACVEGYCPAFVEVQGTPRNKASDRRPLHVHLPDVEIPSAGNMLIAGVGGTGVITLSQIIAVAAHLDGKQSSTLDMTGLAQKGGAVISHIRVDPDHIWRTRLAQGETDLLIAADAVTATSLEVAPLLAKERTHAVVNSALSPSYLSVVDHGRDHEVNVVLNELREWVVDAATVDALKLADEYAGSGTVANTVLLGFAYQCGRIPLTLASLRRAIELNGVAIEANLIAFDVGRLQAEQADDEVKGQKPSTEVQSVDEFIARRAIRLREYQDYDYASEFSEKVERARRLDISLHGSDLVFTRAVADTLFHLMAIKDEYEVARLLTAGNFTRHVADRFNDAKVSYAFAPTWLRNESATGKRRFGSWIKPLLKFLAAMRSLRGTRLDPFRFSSERRLDRRLLSQFRSDLDVLFEAISGENYDIAVDVVKAYRNIKGFGYVRESNRRKAEVTLADLHSAFKRGERQTVFATDRV